jgi:6-phosphofructokinase 1
LATGAERVYLHEDGVTLADLDRDVHQLIDGFSKGKRLGLMLRNEKANSVYTTSFMRALFEEEGGDLFDVRESILGHLQQGGDPSPFDRILATRLASHCIDYLEEQIETDARSACIGQMQGELVFTALEDIPRMMDFKFVRPKKQWWTSLRPTAKVLAQPVPHFEKT